MNFQPEQAIGGNHTKVMPPQTIRVQEKPVLEYQGIPLDPDHFVLNAGHTQSLREKVPLLDRDGRLVEFYEVPGENGTHQYSRLDLVQLLEHPATANRQVVRNIIDEIAQELSGTALSYRLGHLTYLASLGQPTQDLKSEIRTQYPRLATQAKAADQFLKKADAKFGITHESWNYLEVTERLLTEMLGPVNEAGERQGIDMEKLMQDAEAEGQKDAPPTS